MRKNISLTIKSLLMVTLIFFLIICVYYLSFESSKKYLLKHELEYLRAIADARGEELLMFLESRSVRMRDLTSESFIIDETRRIMRREKDGSALSQYLAHQKIPNFEHIYQLSILSLKGSVIASTNPSLMGKEHSQEEYVKNFHKNILVTEKDNGSMGQPEIVLTSSIYDSKTGSPVGFAAGSVLISELEDVLKGEFAKELLEIKKRKSGLEAVEIVIINKDKLLLSRSPFVKDSVLRQGADTLPVRSCLEKNEEVSGIWSDYRGVEVAGASLCLPSLKWTLVYKVDKETIFEPSAKIGRQTLMALFVTIFLLGVLITFFMRLVVLQLRRLSIASSEMARGNYNIVLPVKTRDEVGVLSQSFNEMAKKINERSHELEQSETRYRNLVETLQEGIWVIDEKEKTAYVNPKMAEMLGYTVQEMMGRHLFSFIEEKNIEVTKERLAARRRGVIGSFELELLKKDMSRIYARIVTAPIFEKNEYKGSIAGVIDITDRKMAEEALKESEQRLRAILENMGNPIYIRNMEGRMIFANRALLGFTGFKEDEVIGKTVFENFPEEVARELNRTDLQACEHDGPIQVEENIPFPRGVRTLITIKFSLRDMRGSNYAICGVATDITSIKKTEEALRKSERSLREAQRIAHVGNWEWNIEKDSLDGSDEVFRILGKERYQSAYADLIAAVRSEDRESVENNLKYALRGKRSFAMDFRINIGDVEKIVHAQGEVVRDSSGKPVRMIGTLQDITERKLAEEEVLKLNRELEARVAERTIELETANREIETFTYSAAHDLRSPLRLIDGFSLILEKKQKDKLDSGGQENLIKIREAVRRMSQLIDDLLNLSFVMRADIKTEPVKLSALADSIATDLKKAEPDRDVEFRIEQGLKAMGDERLLRMVLENLIGNAWKFISKKTVQRIEFGSAGERNGKGVFFVKDNGAGFDKYSDRLFEPFQRLHSAREYPGTGIGLATVKRVIQRHEGEVWAESEAGLGAVFYFTLKQEA